MVVGGYINRPLPINFFQNYSHISSVKNWVSIWLSIELVPDILNKAFAISVAKIFTEGTKYNFEPIVAITGTDVTDYIKTYSKLKQLDSSIASNYVSILFLDTLLYNPDRHCYNFGLLTDPDTGEILRLAPNFDNNMALISDNYPSSCIRKNDILIDDFNALLDSGAVWNGYSDTYTLPIITDSLIRKNHPRHWNKG